MTKKLVLAIFLCVFLISTAVGQYKIVPTKVPGIVLETDRMEDIVFSQKVFDELELRLRNQIDRFISGQIIVDSGAVGPIDTFISVDIRTTDYIVVFTAVGGGTAVLADSAVVDSGFWMTLSRSTEDKKTNYVVIKER